MADQFLAPPRVIGVDLNQSASWEIRAAINGFTPSGPVAATSDGRYTVWSGSKSVGGGESEYALVVRDTASGAVSVFAVPAALEQLVAHPRRLQVYALTRSSVITVDSGGLREAGGCATQQDASLTMDGSQLFILCPEGRVIVLDTATMSMVREVVLQDPVQTIQVSADGQRVAAAYPRTNLQDGGVGLYDALTGDRFAFVPAPPLPAIPLGGRLDFSRTFLRAGADRQRLYVSFRYKIAIQPGPDYDKGEMQVLDFDSLMLLGKIEHDTVPMLLSAMAFTPDGRYLVGAETRARWCSALLANLESLVVEQFYSMPVPMFCHPGTAVAAAPLAPTNVSSAVANRRVTLEWSLPSHSPAATSYVVEVRRTAGGPLAGILTTAASPLDVHGVPAGTYYIRIRALNALGSSVASAEHLIVVH